MPYACVLHGSFVTLVILSDAKYLVKDNISTIFFHFLLSSSYKKLKCHLVLFHCTYAPKTLLDPNKASAIYSFLLLSFLFVMQVHMTLMGS